MSDSKQKHHYSAVESRRNQCWQRCCFSVSDYFGFFLVVNLQPQIKGETDEYHSEEHCNSAAVEEFVADAAREEEAELSEAVKGGFLETPFSYRQQQRRVEGELSQEAREGPPSKKPK